VKISVITVCLNSEKTIEKTFASVLAQRHRPLEYVVIDGVSTDGTLDILRDYEPKFQDAGVDFLYISEKDSGIYDAMNKGIKRTTGEIVGIINSDDWYEESCTQMVASTFEKYSPDLVYGTLRLLDDKNEIMTLRYNYVNLLKREILSEGAQHPTVFVKKSIYEQFGYFSLDYKVAADYEFLVRCAKNGLILKALDEILANHQIGGISHTTPRLELLTEILNIQLTHGLLSKEQAKKDFVYALIEEKIKYIARKTAKYFYWLLKTNRFSISLLGGNG